MYRKVYLALLYTRIIHFLGQLSCFLVSRPLLNDTRQRSALLQRSQVSKSSAEKLGCVHRLGTQLGCTIQYNAQYDGAV